MKEIIFASHNQGKIKELKQILTPLDIRLISADELEIPDIEETGKTFEENALLKASFVAKTQNKPALADDSGLCVDALNGRPGVYSARYAPNRDFDKAILMLLKEMAESKNKSRKAHFSCVLALCYPSGKSVCFEGRVDGTIAPKASGKSGFGFDPVFVPDGYTLTFAELGSDIKNQISHRARALKKFLDHIKEKGL